MKFADFDSVIFDGASPSSQRVWIEIHCSCQQGGKCQTSPSSQRVWIEIVYADSVGQYTGSPSSQRVWIEI